MSTPLVLNTQSYLYRSNPLVPLPEENRAILATTQGKDFMLALDRNQDPSRQPLIDNFVEGVHRLQGAFGSIRFWDGFNQQFPQYPVFTKASDLQALSNWGQQFWRQVEATPFQPDYRKTLGSFKPMWDETLQLSKSYPNQHVYDEVKLGLNGMYKSLWALQESGYSPR